MSPTLYIVATPIGHLDDFTPRAVAVLKQVACIFAEDTRHSAKLMQHYNINTPLQAYHEFSTDAQLDNLFQYLYQGKEVALISDAGTPLISDPGYRVVKRALQEDIKVVPVPGACAAVAALSVSGLATDRFSFEGFLPAKAKARTDTLAALVDEPRTMVFYEAPHRIVECLADMCNVFGDERVVTMAREITKTFETRKQAPVAELLSWVEQDSNQQRGEIVLVVEGYKQQQQTELSKEALRLIDVLMPELPPKTVSKLVADYCGVAKKQVYEHILSLKS
jgi:16S rRNA (cytidine1402-2'-O)-methyltransferase